MKIVSILVFVSITTFGQSIQIGKLTFTRIKEDNKPTETVRGQLEVFENNQSKKGRKIKLNIEVIPSRSTNKESPIFIVMGGPGQSATDFVSFFYEIFKKINQHSDLVFIDQRGTGKSNPLRLSANREVFQNLFDDDFVSDEIISSSYSSLSRDNNLKYYGTTNATIDIEEVRKKMSYREINLYGTSYGTRVVMSYINKYPQNVRTATLKGLVPPDLVFPVTFARDAQRSLNLLIEDCKRTQQCNNEFPNLEIEVNKLLNREYPIITKIENPETKVTETISINKGVILLNLRLSLMTLSQSKNLPFVIKQANNNNFQPLTDLILNSKKAYIKGSYDGLTLCVVCFEDYPKLLENEDMSDGFLGTYWVDRIKKACSIWNSEKIMAEVSPMKIHKTQVLLISGDRDAATPPKYGDEVLKYFPNSKHIIVSQGSHSFDGMRNCIENIINDFVVAGQTSGLKTDCVDLIKFPQYKVN